MPESPASLSAPRQLPHLCGAACESQHGRGDFEGNDGQFAARSEKMNTIESQTLERAQLEPDQRRPPETRAVITKDA